MERALLSIEGQTCKKFSVYVGDDHGPREIENIVTKFSKRLNITYRRFTENVGRRSLTQQWDRCINLSSEPWIWVFSDDDEMEEECVSELYRTLSQTKDYYDIYRFNTWSIDEQGSITGIHPPHPDHESWEEYVYCMLKGWRISPLQGLIFSRKAYERIGGFLDLPAGWGSDEAIQIALSGKKGIALISGAKVRFRRSGDNISSQVHSRSQLRARVIAQLSLLKWIMERIDERRSNDVPFNNDVLRNVAKQYFRAVLPEIMRVGNLILLINSFRFAREAWHDSYGKLTLTCCASLWDATLSELRSFSHKVG